MRFSVISRLLSHARPYPRRSASRSRIRLALETLDDRCVPATLQVGPLSGEIPSIQQAISEAKSGDIIMVHPGTYQEQITISTNTSGTLLNNLTIEATGLAQNTIIQLPAADANSTTAAAVEITAAQNVTIRGLTIEGPESAGTSIGYGIEVDGGGNAKIIDNRIIGIEDDPVDGSQNGIGIAIGSFANGQTGSATISGNTVDDYQKNGIVVSNTGSIATISGNTVVGLGPTSLIAQNGIEVSFGAAATVTGNTVIGNEYLSTTADSTGILLYQPGAVQVTSNHVTGSDVGIYAYGATGARIGANIVAYSTYDGILLDDSNQAVVEANIAAANGSYHHDVQNGNVDAGIALFGSSGVTVSGNITNRNLGDGIYADATSTGNVFLSDSAHANTIFDLEDRSVGTGTQGTANTWTKVAFTTSSL